MAAAAFFTAVKEIHFFSFSEYLSNLMSHAGSVMAIESSVTIGNGDREHE